MKRGFRAFVSCWLVPGVVVVVMSVSSGMGVLLLLLWYGRLHIDVPHLHGSLYVATTIITSLADGYLGSRNDEERSEMRYVM